MEATTLFGMPFLKEISTPGSNETARAVAREPGFLRITGSDLLPINFVEPSLAVSILFCIVPILPQYHLNLAPI